MSPRWSCTTSNGSVFSRAAWCLAGVRKHSGANPAVAPSCLGGGGRQLQVAKRPSWGRHHVPYGPWLVHWHIPTQTWTAIALQLIGSEASIYLCALVQMLGCTAARSAPVCSEHRFK